MKKTLLIGFILLFLPGLFMFSQDNSSVNIILFDVSGSMSGKGDGKGIDIFLNVKKVAFQLIQNLEYGTYLVILPFDRGVRKNIFELEINSQDNINTAIQFIDALIADGGETWMTRSFKNATDKLFSLKDLIEKFSEKEQEILIFTDGRGNHAEDKDIENFIRIYDLRKTDFPHLFTKFFAYGELFSQSELDRLKEKKIPVEQTKREKAARSLVEIKKDKIFIYSNKPSFEVKFKFPEKAKKAKIKAEIVSEVAKRAGARFELDPPEFNLSEAQRFDVSIASDIDIMQWMSQNKLAQIKGEFILSSENNLHFHREDRLEFIFAPPPTSIKFNVLKIKSLKNGGKISFKYESSSIDSIKMKVNVKEKNLKKPLNLKIDPKELKIDHKGKLNLQIFPEEKDMYLDFRRNIVDTVQGEVILTFKSETPNVIFEPEEIVVPFIVTPYINYLPFTIGLFLVLLFGGVFFAICKMRTAQFPPGSQLIDSSGKSHPLSTRFCKVAIFIGKDKKSDIKCYKLSEKTNFVDLKPTGLDLMVSKSNSRIVLLDSSGNAKNTLKCIPGDSFELQDAGGNSETYLYQKI